MTAALTRPLPDSTSDAWGDPATFCRIAGVTPEAAKFWASQVARDAHASAHPVPMLDCPGCGVEAVTS